MVIDLIIVAGSIRFIYSAHGLWKYKDIKKYGNRYPKSSDVKNADRYIKWWVRWNLINGILGISFGVLDAITRYYPVLATATILSLVLCLISIFVSSFYPLIRASKFN